MGIRGYQNYFNFSCCKPDFVSTPSAVIFSRTHISVPECHSIFKRPTLPRSPSSVCTHPTGISTGGLENSLGRRKHTQNHEHLAHVEFSKTHAGSPLPITRGQLPSDTQAAPSPRMVVPPVKGCRSHKYTRGCTNQSSCFLSYRTHPQSCPVRRHAVTPRSTSNLVGKVPLPCGWPWKAGDH